MDKAQQSLSPSQKDLYLECRQKWYYEYVEKPKVGRHVSPHLLRGTCCHAAMAAFYRLPPKVRSLDVLLTVFNGMLEGETHKLVKEAELYDNEEDAVRTASSSGTKALTTFWDTLGSDESHWPVTTELRLERLLPCGISYHGIPDGVWRPGDRVVVMEFKFPAESKYDMDEYVYWNPQARAYPWLVGEGLTTTVEYTIGGPRKTVRLPEIYVSKVAVDEEVGVANEVAMAQATGIVYPTYDWHCRMCTYKELCMVRLTGGEA